MHGRAARRTVEGVVSALAEPPHTGPSGPAEVLPARVVTVRAGLVEVETVTGARCWASYGATVLMQLAKDPADALRPGDSVLVRRWPDRRVTLERLCRHDPAGEVVPLRRPR